MSPDTAHSHSPESRWWYTRDHWRLRVSIWHPAGMANQATLPWRCPILLVHGLGEHMGRYQDMAATLADSGHTVAGLDLRGHGHSDGKRGHTPGFQYLIQDLRDFTKTLLAENIFHQPPLVIAHSMGGALATHHALQAAETLSGLMLISPYFQAAFPVNPWRVMAGKLCYYVYPDFTLDVGMDPGALAQDESVRRAIAQDPLCHQKLSARWAIEAMQHAQLLPVLRSRLLMPVRIVHGDKDRITSHRASRFFAEHQNQMSESLSLQPQVHFQSIPDGFHQVHNDASTRPQVWAQLQSLLNEIQSGHAIPTGTSHPV